MAVKKALKNYKRENNKREDYKRENNKRENYKKDNYRRDNNKKENRKFNNKKNTKEVYPPTEKKEEKIKIIKESIIEKRFSNNSEIKPIPSENIKAELDALYHLLLNEEYNLLLSIYFIETLSLSINDKYISDFINLVFKILESKKAPKYFIYNLKIIHCILRLKYFIPVSIELIFILKNSLKLKNNLTNKKISYENIKVDSTILNSLEYKNFVISETLKLLFSHINSFSNTLAFPKLSKIVVDEIKNIKIKDFLNVIKEIINMIEDQSKYIENERKNNTKENELKKISERKRQ